MTEQVRCPKWQECKEKTCVKQGFDHSVPHNKTPKCENPYACFGYGQVVLSCQPVGEIRLTRISDKEIELCWLGKYCNVVEIANSQLAADKKVLDKAVKSEYERGFNDATCCSIPYLEARDKEIALLASALKNERARLNPYLDHKQDCRARLAVHYQCGERPCTCGFEALKREEG